MKIEEELDKLQQEYMYTKMSNEELELKARLLKCNANVIKNMTKLNLKASDYLGCGEDIIEALLSNDDNKTIIMRYFSNEDIDIDGFFYKEQIDDVIEDLMYDDDSKKCDTVKMILRNFKLNNDLLLFLTLVYKYSSGYHFNQFDYSEFFVKNKDDDIDEDYTYLINNLITYYNAFGVNFKYFDHLDISIFERNATVLFMLHTDNRLLKYIIDFDEVSIQKMQKFIIDYEQFISLSRFINIDLLTDAINCQEDFNRLVMNQ